MKRIDVRVMDGERMVREFSFWISDDQLFKAGFLLGGLSELLTAAVEKAQ